MNEENIKRVLAVKLKELREEKGLSQTQLAEKLGVSRGSVSFYENSERMAGIDFIYKAANFFECSSDYLLGLSEYKNSKSESETRELVSNIIKNSSNIPEKMQKDFLVELNRYFDGLNNLECMPILTHPNIQELHAGVLNCLLRLLADTATVITTSEDLQRNGSLPDGIDFTKQQEHLDFIRQAVDFSYKTVDGIIPAFINLALRMSADCTAFLDFMYKGVINGKPTVITTVSDLLGLSKTIKSDRKRLVKNRFKKDSD